MHNTTRLLAIVLMCAAFTAQADTKLVYSGNNGQFVVSVRPGEIRIDDTGDAWQLYRKQSNTIYAINPDKHTYTRMDQDVADTLHQRMKALQAKIEAQLKKLPPERRDIARAVLAEKIPGFSNKPQTVTLEQTGAYDEVAGIKCEIVQVIRDGEPAQRMCVASADALGLSKGGFNTLKAMFNLMHTMLAGTAFQSVGLPYLDLSGMPIRFHSPDGSTKRTLSRVSHQSLEDSLFTVPDTFVEQIPGQAMPH